MLGPWLLVAPVSSRGALVTRDDLPVAATLNRARAWRRRRSPQLDTDPSPRRRALLDALRPGTGSPPRRLVLRESEGMTFDIEEELRARAAA